MPDIDFFAILLISLCSYRYR